jgi:hypothetical protein
MGALLLFCFLKGKTAPSANPRRVRGFMEKENIAATLCPGGYG